MKFTLAWLKDHLETDADAQTIAAKLTNIGLEVEVGRRPGAALARFTVAECISAVPHPNADKLRLCMVERPASGEPVQVVLRRAQRARGHQGGVRAARKLSSPAPASRSKVARIRGVESRGMMCSGRELLISDDHDGIIELAAERRNRRARGGGARPQRSWCSTSRSRPTAATARPSTASRAILPRPASAR